MAGFVETRQFSPGQLLMAEGEHGDCAYIIIDGTITVSSTSLNVAGQKLGTGKVIGDEALLDDQKRSFTATAGDEGCSVIIVPSSYVAGKLGESDLIVASLAQFWGRLRSSHAAPLSAETAADPDIVVARDFIEKIRLASAFRDALLADNGELCLHYQPIIDLRSGRVASLEALMRWFPAGQDPISPGVFIPAIETTDIIIDATRWALKKSCIDLRGIIEHTGLNELSVGFNVTPSDLSTPNFATDTFNTIQGEKLGAHNICIEITERTAFDNANDAPEILATCSNLGITSAIDDYGQGHSSLSRLVDLPSVTKLKIDMAFIRRMLEDTRAMSAVRSAIGLAHNFQIQAVAEGVETAEQLRALRAAGCDYVQGYFLGRPMPASEIPAFIGKFELAA